MKRIYRTPGHHGGFSLIEVMIAVVVLATGLIALAALQTSLTRSSAESKVRGRVAALLTTRMDELRVLQYDNAALLPRARTVVTCVGVTPTWLCDAQRQASLGALTVGETVTTWSSVVGAVAFSDVVRVIPPGEPQFKRVTLDATWTDAGNESHRLSMTSDLSALALRDALLPQQPGSGSGSGSPTVRTDNPVSPGMIPIAIGGSDATAASNPRPEIIGRSNNQSAVGTRFNVLTYSGLSGPAVIQRRIETAAIKCDCKYSAGGANLPVIYRTAEWPAVWTGERYDVYKTVPASAAPGTPFASGPKPNVEQSPLCQECCRDHHDTVAADVAKFDPERVVGASQVHSHYSANGSGQLVIVPDTSNADYVEACRLIRVDGFWRTAADLYSRQMGLLATQSVGSTAAKTGVPATAAATAYQTFVKDYLSQYTDTVVPINADTIFNETARGLNDPVSISIVRPTPKDERYLHARGLYVDYLEKDAVKKIKAVRLKCSGGDLTACMLPYLPFTTINVTELAFWRPEKEARTLDTDTLSVATGGSLIYDPLLPTRGRTNAIATASNAAEAFSAAEMGTSNSGVAIYGGIDLGDETEFRDRQKFVVSAPVAPSLGDKFEVILGGASLVQINDDNTSNDPSVAWATVSPSSGNCNATVKANNPGKDLNPNNYVCNTNATLGTSGSVTVGNYFREYDSAPKAPPSGTMCTSSIGSVAVTANIAIPQFDNFRVDSAKVGMTLPAAVAGSVAAPPTGTDGKKTETTTASFASIPANGFVWLDFVRQSTLEATIASCVATRQNDRQPWEFASVVWNRSWNNP